MTPFMPTVTLSPDALVRIEGGEVITWAECERRLLAARTPAPEGEVSLWGCADGNGIDPRLVFRDRPTAEQVAADMNMVVQPLYASPVVPVGSGEPLFVSETCEGELCWCGKPAVRKVGEEFAYDEPNPERHNLTRYICAYHFAELMGPAGARSVGIAPASVGREEIAAMAWRFRGNERLGGPWYDGAKPSDSPAMHDCFAFADAILAALRPTDTGRE